MAKQPSRGTKPDASLRHPLIPPTTEELAEWAVDRFRSEFLLLRSRVGEKKARQVLKDLLKRPAQRPPGPTNPEHDEELLKIVNVLTKERPISIKQAAKEM